MTTDPAPAVLASRLCEAREWMGFTVEQVAEATGWPAADVVALEAGGMVITGEHLRKLMRLYRRPLEWFQGESTFQPSPEMLRQAERLTPHDREVVLDFLEWLAGAGKPPAPRRTETPGA